MHPARLAAPLLAVALLVAGCTGPSDAPGATAPSTDGAAPGSGDGGGGNGGDGAATPPTGGSDGALPARVTVISLTLDPDTVEAGQPATLAVDVRNAGGATGSGVVAIEVDGAVVASLPFSVPAGGAATLTTTLQVDEVGEHAIGASVAGGEFTGVPATLRVLPPPALELRNLVALPATLDVGSTATARFELVSQSEAQETATVQVLLDGKPAGKADLVVPPGETRQGEVNVLVTKAGRSEIRALLVGSARSLTTHVDVRGVVVANASAAPTPDQFCDFVRFDVGWDNAGEATSRGAKISVTLFDGEGAFLEQQNFTQDLVGPGARGGIQFVSTTAHARCPQTHAFSVAVTIAPPYAEPATFRAGPFQV